MSYEITDPEHKLHWMILKGDIDRAEELLEEDRDIDVDKPFYPDSMDANLFEYEGKRPIHLALMQNNIPFVELLARYDASGTEYSRGISFDNELSPAELAANNGYLAGLKCLDRLYPDLWNQWLSFRIALRAISPRGNTETLGYCLDAVKPHVKWNSHHTQSLLRKAESQTVPADFATYIVNLGIDLNEEETPVDDDGFEYDRKALRQPINYSELGLSENFALSAHVTQLYDGLPLTRAAYQGRLDLVDLYLENGANPQLRNVHGLTAFDAALDNRAEARTKTHEIIHRRLSEAVKRETPNLVVFTAAKRRLEGS